MSGAGIPNWCSPQSPDPPQNQRCPTRLPAPCVTSQPHPLSSSSPLAAIFWDHGTPVSIKAHGDGRKDSMGTPEQRERVGGGFARPAGCSGSGVAVPAVLGASVRVTWIAAFGGEAGCRDQPGTQASAMLQGFGISRWWVQGLAGVRGLWGAQAPAAPQGSAKGALAALPSPIRALQRSARRHPRYSLF